MNFVTELREQQTAKVIEQAEAAAARAREKAAERVRLAAERSERVAAAVIEVAKDRPWPGFSNYEELARAAFEVNGISDDPYFATTKADKKGRPVGPMRFLREVRSGKLTRAWLAEQGVVIYGSKAGAGIPDTETVEETHARRQKALKRAVDSENEKAELESQVLGIDLPRFELRALTAGSS